MRISHTSFSLCIGVAALVSASASFSALAAGDVPLEGKAYQLADQAYRELASGSTDMAYSSVAKALQLRPDSRQLGLLLLDIHVHRAEFAAARQQADDLLARFPDDSQVLIQRGYLAQRQGRHQEAMEDFYAALKQGPDENQQRNVRLAWADSALTTKQYGVVLDALAPYAENQDATVQLRRAYAFSGLNEQDQARAAALLAESGSGTDEQHSAARQLLAQTMPAQQSNLDLAYAELRDKNDRAALEAFERAFSVTPGTASQYSDAAYAAKRAGENERAVALFKSALDANAQLHQAERLFDEQSEFGYRREIQEMSRTFGVVASASYQSSGFGPQNNINILQGGLEAYWQPENIGYRNGSIFQMFARGYETLYDKSGGATGSVSVQGSVGARYKPIGDTNLVLTAEKLFRVGNLASDDWLMRAGYSTGIGSDIQPYNRDWANWQLYTEGAYFMKSGRYIQSLESSYGHSWRMEGMYGRWVLTPHAVLVGDFDSHATVNTALGAGPGISLRYWFREDTYQAPASWLELTTQYRYEFTHTQRARGLTMRATLWY